MSRKQQMQRFSRDTSSYSNSGSAPINSVVHASNLISQMHGYSKEIKNILSTQRQQIIVEDQMQQRGGQSTGTTQQRTESQQIISGESQVIDDQQRLIQIQVDNLSEKSEEQKSRSSSNGLLIPKRVKMYEPSPTEPLRTSPQNLDDSSSQTEQVIEEPDSSSVSKSSIYRKPISVKTEITNAIKDMRAQPNRYPQDEEKVMNQIRGAFIKEKMPKVARSEVGTVVELPKRVNILEEQKKYIIFSDAADSEKFAKTASGFNRLKNYGDQPPDLEMIIKGYQVTESKLQNKSKKMRVKRGILEQHFKDIGINPKETISFHTDSKILQSIVSENTQILNWYLSKVKNPNLIDLQIVPVPQKSQKSDSKILVAHVFQNQINGIQQALEKVLKIKKENLSCIKNISKTKYQYMRYFEDEYVVLRQLVYIKNLNPLVAFYLRYKFFSVGNLIKTEGDIFQDLIQMDQYLKIDNKFNMKLQESVKDVLILLSNYVQQSESMAQILQFQTLELHFLVNTKTERPDLFDVKLSFLHDNQEEPLVYPSAYAQCICSLLLKIDKKVRAFNGLQNNKLYSKRMFQQYWQKIVDKDQTEVDFKQERYLEENLEEKRILDEIANKITQNQQIFELNQIQLEYTNMQAAGKVEKYKKVEKSVQGSDSDTLLDLNTFQDELKRNKKLLEIKNKVKPRQVKQDEPVKDQSSIKDGSSKQSLYQLDYDALYLRDPTQNENRSLNEQILNDARSEEVKRNLSVTQQSDTLTHQVQNNIENIKVPVQKVFQSKQSSLKIEVQKSEEEQYQPSSKISSHGLQLYNPSSPNFEESSIDIKSKMSYSTIFKNEQVHEKTRPPSQKTAILKLQTFYRKRIKTKEYQEVRNNLKTIQKSWRMSNARQIEKRKLMGATKMFFKLQPCIHQKKVNVRTMFQEIKGMNEQKHQRLKFLKNLQHQKKHHDIDAAIKMEKAKMKDIRASKQKQDRNFLMIVDQSQKSGPTGSAVSSQTHQGGTRQKDAPQRMVNPDLKEMSQSVDNRTSVTRRVKPGAKNNNQDSQQNSELGLEGSIHLTNSNKNETSNNSFQNSRKDSTVTIAALPRAVDARKKSYQTEQGKIQNKDQSIINFPVQDRKSKNESPESSGPKSKIVLNNLGGVLGKPNIESDSRVQDHTPKFNTPQIETPGKVVSPPSKGAAKKQKHPTAPFADQKSSPKKQKSGQKKPPISPEKQAKSPKKTDKLEIQIDQEQNLFDLNKNNHMNNEKSLSKDSEQPTHEYQDLTLTKSVKSSQKYKSIPKEESSHKSLREDTQSFQNMSQQKKPKNYINIYDGGPVSQIESTNDIEPTKAIIPTSQETDKSKQSKILTSDEKSKQFSQAQLSPDEQTSSKAPQTQDEKSLQKLSNGTIKEEKSSIQSSNKTIKQMKEDIKELREMVTQVQLGNEQKDRSGTPSPNFSPVKSKITTPKKNDDNKLKGKGYNSLRNSPKQSVSSSSSKVTILRNADDRGFMDSIQDHEVLDGKFERYQVMSPDKQEESDIHIDENHIMAQQQDKHMKKLKREEKLLKDRKNSQVNEKGEKDLSKFEANSTNSSIKINYEYNTVPNRKEHDIDSPITLGKASPKTVSPFIINPQIVTILPPLNRMSQKWINDSPTSIRNRNLFNNTGSSREILLVDKEQSISEASRDQEESIKNMLKSVAQQTDDININLSSHRGSNGKNNQNPAKGDSFMRQIANKSMNMSLLSHSQASNNKMSTINVRQYQQPIVQTQKLLKKKKRKKKSKPKKKILNHSIDYTHDLQQPHVYQTSRNLMTIDPDQYKSRNLAVSNHKTPKPFTKGSGPPMNSVKQRYKLNMGDSFAARSMNQDLRKQARQTQLMSLQRPKPILVKPPVPKQEVYLPSIIKNNNQPRAEQQFIKQFLEQNGQKFYQAPPMVARNSQQLPPQNYLDTIQRHRDVDIRNLNYIPQLNFMRQISQTQQDGRMNIASPSMITLNSPNLISQSPHSLQSPPSYDVSPDESQRMQTQYANQLMALQADQFTEKKKQDDDDIVVTVDLNDYKNNNQQNEESKSFSRDEEPVDPLILQKAEKLQNLNQSYQFQLEALLKYQQQKELLLHHQQQLAYPNSQHGQIFQSQMLDQRLPHIPNMNQDYYNRGINMGMSPRQVEPQMNSNNKNYI